jgi:hypothetical protein
VRSLVLGLFRSGTLSDAAASQVFASLAALGENHDDFTFSRRVAIRADTWRQRWAKGPQLPRPQRAAAVAAVAAAAAGMMWST